MTKVEFHVLDAAEPGDRAEWNRLVEESPCGDVQDLPGYVSLYADAGVDALCAIGSSQGATVIYPFLRRAIPQTLYSTFTDEPLFDITTAYGYGGAFGWGTTLGEVTEEFWRSFDHWSASNKVVSEFVRFRLQSDSIVSYPGQTTERQQNIVRSLDGTREERWAEFDAKVRKNVRRAEREGLTVLHDPAGTRFREFREIYLATMGRRDAAAQFHFDEAFFQAIHENLPGHFCYFHVLHQGAVIASELVLLSDANIYSFLGGTNSDYFHLRPNDLLKAGIIEWGADSGRRDFVLGGGASADDGIYRYKRSFAPSGGQTFRTGSRILDPVAYASLHTVRERMPGEIPADFFPSYRA